MMRKDLIFYSGLLLASLGIAYYASIPTQESESDSTEVLNIPPLSVSEIQYKDKEQTIVMKRQGEKFWIDFNGQKKSPDGQSSPDQEGFLGNDKVPDVLAFFAPFRALRVIGKADETALEEFGLKSPEEFLEIKRGDSSLKLSLGKKSYGSRNMFVRGDDGRVFLVDSNAIDLIKNAKVRLYERKIFSFPMEDVQSATIAKDAKDKKLLHTKRDERGNLVWTEDREGASANATYESWISKIDRLRLVSFYNPHLTAEYDSLPPLFSMSFSRDGKELDSLVFKLLPAGQESGKSYIVKSKYLGLYAKLPAERIEPIASDLNGILGD